MESRVSVLGGKVVKYDGDLSLPSIAAAKNVWSLASTHPLNLCFCGMMLCHRSSFIFLVSRHR
jgi:hypothetical protein